MSTFQVQIASSLGSKSKILSELPKTILRPLMQLALKSVAQEHIEVGILDRISEKYNVSQEKVDEWYAAILTILKLQLRSPAVKSAELKQCLQELKLAPDCIEVFHPVSVNGLTNVTKFYPHLKSCKWRVDITISSSVLSRVMEPSILMEWTLSTGESKIFEMSLARFHQLRYAIVSLLMEMQVLENSSVIKCIASQ